MPRTKSDASAYSQWGQASVSRGTSFGWVHGDRHEACHPHTSRFFPVLVLRLRRLNYEHPSFFFIRSYLLCLIRPAFGGSARGAHGRRSCPELFPLTSLGQVARNATRRGRLEGRRDGGRGRPNPGSRPERRPSIAGQKTSPAGAPPPLQATDRAVGRSAYARPEGEPMPLLSSRQPRGRMRSACSPL
jgi:hypothetical protein